MHLSGIRALNDIAKAFELKDITELIKMNADYFTHHVNIKLRKVCFFYVYHSPCVFGSIINTHC